MTAGDLLNRAADMGVWNDHENCKPRLRRLHSGGRAYRSWAAHSDLDFLLAILTALAIEP